MNVITLLSNMHIFWITDFCILQNESALPGKSDKHERQLRRKKRVTRMVAIVVFLFGLCWFPIHLIALWIQFDSNFPRTDAMHYFKLFGHTLSYANSCVNPFVYAFVNEGFKQAILKGKLWYFLVMFFFSFCHIDLW